MEARSVIQADVIVPFAGDDYIVDAAIVTRVTPCTRYLGMAGAGQGWKWSRRRIRFGQALLGWRRRMSAIADDNRRRPVRTACR